MYRENKFELNSRLRRYHSDYVKNDLPNISNRELLRDERQTRKQRADIEECEARQKNKEQQYYLGDDLPTVKK